MKLQLNDNLIFDTLLKPEEQPLDVQEYISNIAFDYSNANQQLSMWQGTGEPGQPIRYDVLVHDIPTKEGAFIRATVDWNYKYPYGNPACFAGTQTLRLEVLHG